MISDADAAFPSETRHRRFPRASYDVDAADPAAPELLPSIGNQAIAFKVAWLEIGPDQFSRHLGMQIARMHVELDKARSELRLLLEFHAPARGAAIN